MTDPRKPTPLPEPEITMVYESYENWSFVPADSDWFLKALDDDKLIGFTADQMTAHELAGYRRGLEAAAQACEQRKDDTGAERDALKAENERLKELAVNLAAEIRKDVSASLALKENEANLINALREATESPSFMGEPVLKAHDLFQMGSAIAQGEKE